MAPVVISENHQSSSLFNVPEIFKAIIDSIKDPSDVLNCALVNKEWNSMALKRLYKGSINDMRWRTPQVGFLNCLLTSSRERFAQCMNFVKHLVLLPETPSAIQYRYLLGRLACYENCRALRCRSDAELLLQPHDKGPISVIMPLHLQAMNITPVLDLVFNQNLRYLASDGAYCQALMNAIPNTLNNVVVSFMSTYLNFSLL